MTDKPKVSIIMRTKDREILLKRALFDVSRQTYANFELIIVNDGGVAKTVDALLEKHNYLEGRAQAIHNPQSTGMEHASNQGISAATGKYICIHDDDDTWNPCFLEECVNYLEAHPDHGGVAVRTEIVYEEIKGNKVVENGRVIAWPEVDQFSISRLMKSNIAVPISCMYPKAVIEKLGGFRADLPVVGDWEFHLRLAIAYQVGFLADKKLAYWHQRPAQGGSLGNSVFEAERKHRYFDLQVRDDYLREYAEKNGVGALLWQAAVMNGLFGSNNDPIHRSRKEQIKDVLRPVARPLLRQLRCWKSKFLK